MCISVDANGLGTHVSVFVRLMRGEYDSRLVWPFRGDITIQLVNHNNDRDHCERTVNFNDAASGTLRVSDTGVTVGVRADYWRGCDRFITHTKVESTTKARQCIVNDCLTFRITKIVVHSVTLF